MTDLSASIRSIYERAHPHILPFIGRAFVSPKAGDFRAMAVGINAYLCGDDWGRQPPELNAQWFEKQAYRFQRGVHRDLTALSTALVAEPFLFSDRSFAGMDSFFVTNAIKVYMHEADGKTANQLSDAHFEAHLGQWHDELDAMADARVLPHVIAIVGEPFWRFAWQSFRPSRFRTIDVTEYRSTEGACHHFVNRLILDVPGGAHDLLLVRLRHPAARARTGSPKWLLGQPEFRALATR